MAYAGQTGLQRYFIAQARGDDPDIRDVDHQLLFSSLLNDEAIFRERVSRNKVGEGLSPFGVFRFQLDEQEYSDILETDPRFLTNARGFLLMFDVDYRPISRPMTWLGPCAVQ